MLAEKTLSELIASLDGNVRPLALSPSSLYFSWIRGLKRTRDIVRKE